MTTPELRIAPDGRVATRTHRLADGDEWAVVAGPDASWLTRSRPSAAEVETWTLLVPAVSSGPDTEALRQQVVDAIERELELARSGEGYEAAAVAEEIVRRYWPDVAGLRADLDRARRERDEWQQAATAEAVLLDEANRELDAARTRASAWKLRYEQRGDADLLQAEAERLRSEVERLGLEIQGYQVDGPYQRGHEHGQQARQAEVDRARAEVERLTAVYDRTHEALRGLLPEPGVAGSLDDVPISHLVVRLARQVAHACGDRTIPDDAAVDRLAARLIRLKVYGVGLSDHDERVRRQWTNVFTAEERDVWRREARALLADLGATPTTDPAPAAADEPSPWPFPVERDATGQHWTERDGLLWAVFKEQPYVLQGPPRTRDEVFPPTAAPQAPAEPRRQCAWWWDTKQCPDWALPGGKYCDGHQRDHNDLLREVPEAAREDTAPPDDYGDNLGGWNRAAAPAPANPTPEEEQ